MSTLSQAAENYLALRRSLGHDLADAHRLYLDSLLTWTGSVRRRSPSRRP